jgi:hypothetical protein
MPPDAMPAHIITVHLSVPATPADASRLAEALVAAAAHARQRQLAQPLRRHRGPDDPKATPDTTRYAWASLSEQLQAAADTARTSK